jgi:hypothetical protein
MMMKIALAITIPAGSENGATSSVTIGTSRQKATYRSGLGHRVSRYVTLLSDHDLANSASLLA